MLDIMYEIPSRQDIGKFVITRDIVLGKAVGLTSEGQPKEFSNTEEKLA